VRTAIAALAPPRTRMSTRAGPFRLFVFGGSQGAAALNRLVPEAVAMLPLAHRPVVLHQTGTRDRDATEASYRAAGIQADVRAYIDDMAAAYADADLVVSRAGASTVAELAAAGVASILVPFPAAVDDHQTKNAEWLAQASAAQIVSEAGLTAGELANRLATLFSGGRAKLLAMAEAARSRAVRDSAERVAALCLEAEGMRA
jgi:UDP-N-acetylglucosamine--N-acetylmuramyl-(pentapeptide) pyrophosphoryl-undecaprenol N-acetylglucosamine transferase